MITKGVMECKYCKKTFSVKNTVDYISLRCGCKCIILYPNGRISEVPIEKYNKNIGVYNG